MSDIRDILSNPRLMAKLQAAGYGDPDYSTLNTPDPGYVPLSQQREQKLANNPNSATASLLANNPNPPQMPQVPGNANRPQDNPYPVLPPGAGAAQGVTAPGGGAGGYTPPRLPTTGGVDPNAVDATQMAPNRTHNDNKIEDVSGFDNRDMQVLGSPQYQQLVKNYLDQNAPQDFVASRMDRDRLRNTLTNYMKYAPVQTDFSPLAGLTAAWSRDKDAGKAVAASYEKPANMSSDAAMIAKMQGDLSKADNDVSSQDNSLAHTLTGGMFVTKGTTNTTQAQGQGYQPVRGGGTAKAAGLKSMPSSLLNQWNVYMDMIRKAKDAQTMIDQNPKLQGMGEGALANLPFSKVPFIGDNTQRQALRDKIEALQNGVTTLSAMPGTRFSPYAGGRADKISPSINQPYSRNHERAQQIVQMAQQDAQQLLDSTKGQHYDTSQWEQQLSQVLGNGGGPAGGGITAPGGGKSPGDDHEGALDFIKKNPNDPRVPGIKARLKASGFQVN